MASSEDRLAAVDDVRIDRDGVYKYVLINVTAGNKSTGVETSKKIVRGFSWAGYHADIYEAECSKLEPIGLDCECLGGGRISTSSSGKTIKVYGYSVGFGRAEHQVTCDILRKSYPDYNITWSNEGY